VIEAKGIAKKLRRPRDPQAVRICASSRGERIAFVGPNGRGKKPPSQDVDSELQPDEGQQWFSATGLEMPCS